MRTAFLTLLAVAGGWRLVGAPVQEAPAKPPIEIRLVGASDPDLERRIEEILADFPELKRHRTRRFEILTDLSGPEAARDGQLLERTAHAVDDFGVALGYPSRLETPREVRHLAIAFARRDDFIRFSRGRDGVDGTWLGGYFSPRGPHLVYHNAADHPAVRRARNRIDRAAEPDRNRSGDLVSPHEVLDEYVTKANAAVVVHEATHMLLHDGGIAPADSMQSDWLLEGLAGSFEPARPDRRFGPLRPTNGRTEEFRELLAVGDEPTLHDLVSRRRFSPDRNAHACYAASATLCSWLARNRPMALRRYLDLTGTMTDDGNEQDIPGDADGDHLVRKFEEVFGDLARLEREWIRSERAAASIPLAVVSPSEEAR